jgi:hypothetical protein
LETVILVLAGLVAIGFALFAMHKKGVANFWLLLVRTNKLHGTRFGTSPSERSTIIGASMYKGGVLAFDRANRKIAYLTKGGNTIEILGYDFIRSWTIVWREKTSAGGAQFGMVTVGASQTSQDKVFIEIKTNDLNRPILRMPMSSLRYAQETSARLDSLLNNKN